MGVVIGIGDRFLAEENSEEKREIININIFSTGFSILKRMVKKFYLIIVASLVLGGCGLDMSKSGVEIICNPSAQVMIDGKEMGMTPYKNNSLKPGEIEIKLTQGKKQWSRKVHLENNANTVVNWDFSQENQMAGGYVLYLEPTGNREKAGFLVSSTPDKAAVAIDGEIKTLTPGKIDDFGEGDKQVVVSFPGYKSIIVFVKAINGYQLILESELAKETVINTGILSPTPSTNDQTSDEPTINQVWVEIKETETGWLRVRDIAGSEGVEIKKVNTGEKYKYLEEKNDWYKIDLGKGDSGWISAKYAEKL